MQCSIEVHEPDGSPRRRGLIDLPLCDPPAASGEREILAVIAFLLLEGHDRDVRVHIDGRSLEVSTAHAVVTATLPAALDYHAVREAVESVGLTLV